MKLIRVLRLLRMLRLVRVVKLFKRWHIRSGFPYSAVKIITCGSVTLLLVHWLACVWGHLGLNPLETDTTTWLANHLTSSVGVDQLSTWEVYQNSLYLCVVVLTSVGFGDITPTSEREETSMTLTLFFTGVTWAWVVANVVAVISNMDPFGAVFNQVMDDLNALMSSHGVDNSLRLRVRRHVHESYKIQREVHHLVAIKWLSAGLQGELAMQSGVDHVCSRIWYLKNIPENVVVELADEFKGDLFSPGEVILDRTSLSVIIRGSCIRRGVMLTRDAVFGEDMILASESLRDSACPRTLTFLEVMKLHLDSLFAAAAKYPVFDTQLRRSQIKLAIWRSFVHTADKIKKERERTEGRNKKARQSTWDRKLFDEDRKDSKNGQSNAVKMRSWVAVMKGEIPPDAPEFVSEMDSNTSAIMAKLCELEKVGNNARTEADMRWRDMESRFVSMDARLDSMGTAIQQIQQQQIAREESPVSPKTPKSAKSVLRVW